MNTLTPPRTMFEVFKSLPEGTLCQLINNQLIMSPAPSDPHQYVTGEIFGEIRTIVKKKKLGQVRIAPYDVYLNNQDVYQPDVVFILEKNINRIHRNGLHGAPDLVVEVLSPDTAKYDKKRKKEMYERYGVKEYWIVAPESKEVIFYKLVDEKFVEQPSSKGTINSQLLGTEFTF